jgi:hypothetical protein
LRALCGVGVGAVVLGVSALVVRRAAVVVGERGEGVSRLIPVAAGRRVTVAARSKVVAVGVRVGVAYVASARRLPAVSLVVVRRARVDRGGARLV